MYVKVLSADLWEGVSCRQEETTSPSWGDIETAVKFLDGKRRTLVTLAGEGDVHMAIGGGEQAQYIVYVTFDNQVFRTLLSAKRSELQIKLFVGGQLGEYPKDVVVDLVSALAAAKMFAESGKLNTSLNWRDD